jgi:hypothetical protein
MSLQPTNEADFAVDAILGTIRRSVEAFRADTAAGERGAGVLGAHVDDLRRGLRQLAIRWKRLDRDSPYRQEGIQEALALVRSLVEAAANAGPGVASILSLDDELADLLTIETQLRVAAAILGALEERDLSARKAAKLIGRSYSYVSELQGARRTLPSEETCQAIDEHLGTSLVDLVSEARERVDAHRQAAADRRRRRGGRGSALVSADPRIQAIADQLAVDDSLLQAIEDIVALPENVRRRLGALASELQTTLT